MADLTYEILTDREQYPDDQEITLSNGKKTTVKAMRDALMPKADFTRASETWATEKRGLQQTVEQRQQQAEALNQQLAEALRDKEPVPSQPTGTYSEADLEADPVIGPVLKRAKDAQARLDAAEARMAAHEKYVMTREYQGRLNAVEGRYNSRFNKDGKKPFDMPRFLEYVQRNPVLSFNPQTQAQDADIETMFEKFTRNEELAALTHEAEERGIEKGRAAAQVPNLPFGRRRSAPPAEHLPKSGDIRDVSDEQIANDPEMIAAMQKDLEGA